MKPVDFESIDASQTSQTLYIRASDKATPAKTADITVTYTFTNDNDNPPQCSVSYATKYPGGKVEDGTAASSVVGVLSCYDRDATTATPTTITFTLVNIIVSDLTEIWWKTNHMNFITIENILQDI